MSDKFVIWLIVNICLPKCYYSFVSVGAIFEFMAKSGNITTPPPPLDPACFQCLDYLPKMVIIEPDRVLWPFDVGTDVVKPFLIKEYPITEKPKEKLGIWGDELSIECRELTDHNGTLLKMHRDSTNVIIYLVKKGIKVAVAETTKEIIVMRHLLHLFDIDHLFDFMELDLDSAVNHVKIIKEESGFNYQDIIYFGANKSVLNEIKEVLNVTTIHVNPESGINLKHIYRAIYVYNIKLYMQMANGEFSFQGRIVSEENVERTSPGQKQGSEQRKDSKPVVIFPRLRPLSLKATKQTTKINVTSNKEEKTTNCSRKVERTGIKIKTTKVLTLCKTGVKEKNIVVIRRSGNKRKKVNISKLKSKRKSTKKIKIKTTLLPLSNTTVHKEKL